MTMTSLINQGQYGIGTVRWNGNIHSFESMDQNGHWHMIQQSVIIPGDLHELLDWAGKQKRRQERLQELRQKYSSLDEALKNLEIISSLIDEMPGMVP